MNKRINTLIKETKDNIAEVINNGLDAGLPIAIIDLIVEGIVFEVKNTLNSVLAQEKLTHENQLKHYNEQSAYNPKEETE